VQFRSTTWEKGLNLFKHIGGLGFFKLRGAGKGRCICIFWGIENDPFLIT